MRGFAERKAVKLGSVAQPLRAALTGRTTSPGIFDVLAVLGRDESLARLARSGATAKLTAAGARLACRTLQCTTEWDTQNSWAFHAVSRSARQHEQCTVRSRGRRVRGSRSWTRRSGANTKIGQAFGRRQETGRSRSTAGRSGPTSSTSASSTPRPACSPTTRASPRPPAASPRSPTSTATKASCSIAAIRSSSSPSTATSSRPATCCSTANCRPPRRRPTSTIASRATPWCTSR